MPHQYAIAVADDAWEINDALDDPTDRLVVTVTVTGYPLHLAVRDRRQPDRRGAAVRRSRHGHLNQAPPP